MTHPPTEKMRPSEVRWCGCLRCQDALRMHDRLDQLIANHDELDAAIQRLEQRLLRPA